MTVTDRGVGPQIDGLTFVEHLGSGGYSDVYLYEQVRPRMRVAVKVLTGARLSEAELAQFAAEAETMAELADHPYIVQVFATGTTDDGRPYLVMKYYPPPNLGVRAATERFSVADVLRTGIQISSAVETAHRVGILHRDIKPANILTSSYGEPGLADFGIAGKAADADGDDDLGVSIPWSPPEILSGVSNGSVASDVYSLAATLWHLLAGRSPFETPGGDNAPRALMGRILTSPPPPTGRADAPASLERLLQQSMAKRPEHRPPSALEFARSLQMIEQELRYARTKVIVEGAAASTPPRSPAQSPCEHGQFAPPPDLAVERQTPLRESGPPETTVRPARPTLPPRPTPAPRLSPSAESALATPTQRNRDEDGTRLRPATPVPRAAPRQRHLPGSEQDSPATVRRPATAAPADAQPSAEGSSRRGVKVPWVLGAVAVVAVAAVASAWIVMSSGSTDHGTREPNGPVGSDQAGFTGSQAAAAQPPTFGAPRYNAATHQLTFTWSALVSGGAAPQFVYSIDNTASVGPTTATSVTVKSANPAATCIVVGTLDPATGTLVKATRCGAG